MLDGFITRFVLCGQCKNPETVLEITKQQSILKNCKACGAVSKVDMRHKLTSFILKNPPPKKKIKDKYKDKEKEELARKAEKKERKERKRREEEEGLTEEEKKAKKLERKREKEAKKAAKASRSKSLDDVVVEEDDDDEDEDDVEWQTDTSKEAAEKRAQEQLTSAAAAMVIEKNTSNGSNGNEIEEESEEEEEDDEDEVIEKLKTYASSHSPSEITAIMKTIPSNSGLRGQVRILFRALFDAKSLLLSQMKSKLDVLQKAIASTGNVGQMAFLCAVEHYLAELAHDQVKYTAHILKFLYDEDVLEEEVLINWADNAQSCDENGLEVSYEKSKAVREAASKIIEWLKNAESDDEDED